MPGCLSGLLRSLDREIQLLVEASRVEGTKLCYPKVFSSLHLFLGHIPLRYFFNDYDTEISIKVMARLIKMPVYSYRICSCHVVPVLVYASVRPLRLDFAYVLLFVAL